MNDSSISNLSELISHDKVVSITVSSIVLLLVWFKLSGSNDNDKSVGAEYTEFDREGNTKIFKDLYKGGFELKVHHIPGAEVIIPIEVNTKYAKEKDAWDMIVDKAKKWITKSGDDTVDVIQKAQLSLQ